MGVDVLAVGVVSQGDGLVGLVATGDAGDNVQVAGLEVSALGVGNDLLVDDLADLGDGALVVALEELVLHQGSGLVSLVVGLDAVGAGVGISIGLVPSGSLDVSSVSEGIAVLGVEAVGQVDAVAVVHDVELAQPQGQVLSGEGAVSDGVEVGQVLGINGDGEGQLVQQTDALELLGDGAVLGGVGAVVSVEGVEADEVHAGHVVLAGSLSGDGGGEGQGEGDVVLSGDSGAIGELQIVVQLDGDGAGAVLVVNLGMLSDDGVVPDVAALLGSNDGLQTDDQVLNVQVSSAGVVAAEGGVTELAGQVGGVAQDDGVVLLGGGPVDQSGGRGPVGVGGVLNDAADLSVVQIVVLVGVQGDLGQQVVPALDVQLPPGGVDVILGLPDAALGDSAVVDHGVGQEVHAQGVQGAIDLDVGEAGLGILDDLVDGDVLAELAVQGDVVNTVLLVGQGLQLGDVLSGRLSGLDGCGGGGLDGSSGLNGLGAAGNQAQNHDNRQNQGKQFLHFLFLLLILPVGSRSFIIKCLAIIA